MSQYHGDDDDYARSRSGHGRDHSPSRRDRSPDYSSGGAVYAPVPYPLGPPAFAPPPPRAPNMSLQVPTSRYRPRSVPPVSTAVVQRRRSRSRARSRSSSRSSSSSGGRPRSPLGKAKHVVKESFTPTPTGIGAGLLGALVGGLAMREVSDATVRRRNAKLDDDDPRHRPQDSKQNQKAKLVSTLVGAVVGGLSANAIEKKFETARANDKERQEAWERRWGKPSDLPHYDTGNPRDRDHGRGRGRKGGRDADEDYDYVYDSRPVSRRNRSEDPGFRYRN